MKDLLPAIAISVVLHLLIAGALVFSWASEPQVRRVPKTPTHIQAIVLEKPAAKAAPRPAPAPKPAARPPQPKSPPPKTVNTKPTVKTPEPPKPQPKPEPPAPQPPRINVPQVSLDDLLAQEDEAMRQQQAKEAEQARLAQEQQDKDIAESQTYVEQIIALVSSRWIIPATARAKDSLKVEVRLQLLPGGEVIDATIVKSSGDRSFDDSVLNAIRNTGKLPVPSGRLFQENFRSLRLEFKPEMVNP